MRIRTIHRVTALAAVGVLALAACAKSDRDSGGGDGNSADDVFVFGNSADPATLDPVFASDGETFRVAEQIYEGLVGMKPGTTEIVPDLATDYQPSADGLSWTFNLRDGVKFQDGTPFNSEAVCFNFDRWYNLKGELLQSPSVTYYWQAVFGGFATRDNPASPEDSLYASCEATEDLTAVIHLTAPSSAFLQALVLPPFMMQSPAALAQFEADKVSGEGDAPVFEGSYWDEHPTGTGPYKFSSWDRGNQVELVRNDDYWGDKAKIGRVVFRVIAEAQDRKQALTAGSIDAYDDVDPGDIQALKDEGYNVFQRDPFSLGYIGFNMAKPPMDKLEIRQAFAYAVDREALVQAKYPDGAEVANEFMPDLLPGANEDVIKYEYNPDKARDLIEQSGVENPTIDLAYPTDVSRPYMPNPQDNWSLIKADLEAVGFTVNEVKDTWSPDYLDKYQSGDYMAYLIGWKADYADTDNFLGVFFRDLNSAFNWDNPEVRQLLTDARAETDPDKRADMYMQANEMIMEDLPGLPYVLVGNAGAVNPDIKGFTPNPVTAEDYSVLTRG